METSLINVVAVHPTAETSAPVVPAADAVVASWSGWTTFGSVDLYAHDVNLESLKIPGTEYEGFKVQAPRSLAPKDLILLKNGIGEGEFVASEVSEEVLTIASNKSITANVATQAATLTFRTVVIETKGVKYEYYPKCAVIAVDQPADNTGEYNKQQFLLIPMGTTSIPGGVQTKWYQ